MKQQKKGVIINIASDVAVISPDHRIYEPDDRFDYKGVPFNTPIGYSVTKSGILAFTRYLATYWAKDGIRVNCISPGSFPSENFKKNYPKTIKKLVKKIPLKRFGNPEDIIGPLLYLSTTSSKYVTGTNLIVDGGFSSW